MKAESKTGQMPLANEKSRVSALISGILIGYALTCIIIIGYAILITYSSLTGENLPLVVTVTCLASVIVAGFDAASGAESRGWLWGITAGFIYAVILAALGVWVNKGFALDSRTITLLVLSVAGGGLGGVIGINFKKK
ncbi:MAG: TIGR04086 family membrane protein [Clostridiales bacterium]|jgi:putative membrane protein (TIGR04086 family)|nr:TIGR04086 family membrane protein [Clostridiales bacterium]